jgi:hypothetical protein
MSFHVHNITSSDVDVAVRYDPSTDRNAWQRGAQTIEDYFSPGGIFWAEPITPDGEYIADQTVNMNVSGDAGNGGGLNLGGKIDSDIENDSAIGIATGNDANSGVHIKSDNINDSDIDNSNSTAMDISTSTDTKDDTETLEIDPPAQEQEDCTPPTDCPPPAAKKPRAKPKKAPTKPQVRTPQISRRTTRASAGADALKREIEMAKEKEEKLALPSKTAFVNLKRKKGEEEQVAEPSKSVSDELKGDEGGKSPLRKRKQPKREAKNKKK